jgi:signal transduction histidine kinase
MTTWLKWFDTWPRQIVVLVCVCLVALIGLVDYLTGYETFCFTFYLAPIFLATWRGGGNSGIVISALSVTAWISSNIEAGEHYSSYFVPVWNAGIMFAVYLSVVFLLTRLKKIHDELEARVRLRTEALARELQQRMRLQKELLETTDREQRRIGRELHDGLCQHLTGTAMSGHLLEQKLTAQSQSEAAEASRLVQLIEAAIELTRHLSHQLDPVELKTGKLTDHFADLAASTSDRVKVTCRFENTLAGPLEDAAVATHFFRIGQTAVANAVKHSQAAHINICLDADDDEIVLTVTDDGAAPAEKPNGDDHGLRAMAYRADLMGATLNIERLATRGTRVTCVLPASGLLAKNRDAKN